MQAHLKAHMEEAHRKAKICLTCDPPSFLDTTALYFDHLDQIIQHNELSSAGRWPLRGIPPVALLKVDQEKSNLYA